MSDKPSIEFHLEMPAQKSDSLLSGYLLLKHSAGEAGVKLKATSGSRGHQYRGSWSLKGRGPLPPTEALAPKSYSLSTQRLWLPGVKGVEGSFYAIAPFSVSFSGVERGDFGIHFDANVPGSAGCIVIPIQSHWDIFRHSMTEWRIAGIQTALLTVLYS